MSAPRFCAILALGMLAAPAFALANDEPDELIPGKTVGVKAAALFKFLAKAPDGAPFDLPDAPNDPTVVGGTLHVFDSSEGAGDDLYSLPVQAAPLGWKGLGSPTGSKGYKYKGAGTPADPCKVVLVTPKVVKAVCKGAGVELAPPFVGEAAIVLTLGSDSKRYCASFGGTETKNDASQLKRKIAPAPVECPETLLEPLVGIFVDAISGSDAFPGTMEQPKQTIQAGIGASASGGIVYISTGTYNESISLADGVSLFGGYSAAGDWAYATTNVVTIEGGTTAVVGTSINTPTELRDLTVRSSDNAAAGGSSYGIHLTSSSMVTVTRVEVDAGNGGAGTLGGGGSPGASAFAGGDGNPGCENGGFPCDTCSIPAGGTAGDSLCGRTGGVGGLPGLETSGGADGEPGTGGTSGGMGAVLSSGNGAVGGHGANGSPGVDGSAGVDFGTAGLSGYVTSDGDDGEAGTDANGGGGGGGGGGGDDDCNSYGSSGGGGGGGGCAGTAGDGGTGGGGSFGIYLHASSLAVSQSEILTGTGGTGGAGGTGGDGGTGGSGGTGGAYGGSGEQDDGGFGAAGGNGGEGGRGGHGGGGGGGPSVGIACGGGAQLSINSGNSFMPGTGGNGGTSQGFPGAAGLSATTTGCP
jgi:hypothetical protein